MAGWDVSTSSAGVTSSNSASGCKVCAGDSGHSTGHKLVLPWVLSSLPSLSESVNPIGGGSRGGSGRGTLGRDSNQARSIERSGADAAGAARVAGWAWVAMVTDKAESARESRGAVSAGGGHGQSRETRKDDIARGKDRGGGGAVNQKGSSRGKASKQSIFQLGSFSFGSEMGKLSSTSVRHGGEASSRAHTAVLVIGTSDARGSVVGAMRPGVRGGRAVTVSRAQPRVQGSRGHIIHPSVWRGEKRGDK